MKLDIAPGLSLPVEAAGETFLIVGKRGSGKSSTATRFAEQLVRAKVPIAILDPVDVWWGLKAGGDGKRVGGLEVYVFGGDHADLPLESTAGSLLADVVVDHRVNVVMVLRAFSNREKARFVSDFAEQLYRRNRDTMHLFCEEAHEVMPQNPYAGEEEMLGRMLRLEKQGRTSGIGMTAITQRPASLNKNATTQAEILVAHRILGPQDVKAIDGWIQHHHQQDKRQEVLATLGELKTGEAWVWAPDFPEDNPVGLRRVQVLLPETFDSRRTPKPGERRTQPKELAAVDLEQLRTKMTAAIERQKADDPRALRAQLAEQGKRIRELERRPELSPVAKEVLKRVEVAVLRNGALKGLRHISEQWVRAGTAMLEAEQVALQRMQALRSLAGELAAVITPVRDELARIQSAPTGVTATKEAVAVAPVRAGPVPIGSAMTRGQPGERSLHVSRPPQALTTTIARPARTTLGKGEHAVLRAVAQHDGGVARDQLTILTGYKRSTRNTYVQRLAAAGYVQDAGDVVAVTDAGVDVLGPDFEMLPTGDALREYWLGRLGGGERAILAALCHIYPKDIARDDLSESTEYARSSRNTYLQRLGARRLVEGVAGGRVRAAAALFS